MRTANDRLALVGGTVVTREAAIDDGIVLVEDGRIVFVGSRRDADPEPSSAVVDASGKLVLPGLVDTHVHGSHGDDVTLGDPEGVRRISRALARHGTTAYLPTTVSASRDVLLGALEACVEAQCDPGPAAEVVGVRLEGPFINACRRGAHAREAVRAPDPEECRELLEAAPGRVRIVTLAPELPGALETIRLLGEYGIIASLGHSDADYDTALAAIEAGASHATHLYNAMSPLHHREPGLAVACLVEPAIRAEIILDGVHVAPAMARLAARAKGRDGLALVTDATAAVGRPDGVHALGGVEVHVRGDRCTLADGVTIAGSVLTMNRAVANAVALAGMDLVDAVYAASYLPATLCDVADRKGSLEVGKDADVAVLDADFSTFLTLCRGEVAYLAAGAQLRTRAAAPERP
jgi:N-acetylglucosamine-6-phosphate deacetylase